METQYANAALQNGLTWEQYFFAGSMAIGKGNASTINPTSYAHRGAWLELGGDNTTRGLLLPRVADTDSIIVPTTGMLVYSHADEGLMVYIGSAWIAVGSGKVGSGIPNWVRGQGDPSNGLGVDGDYYVNDTNYILYQKRDGQYFSIANLDAGTYTALSDKETVNLPAINAPLSSALALKASLGSPAFTGIPTAPTAPFGTNTTQIATMAALKAAIDALIAGAPGALDTLNEIAAQLANDESALAALVTTVGLKAADNAVVHVTSAETVAGVKTFSSSPIVPTPTTSTQAATKGYVDSVGVSGFGINFPSPTAGSSIDFYVPFGWTATGYNIAGNTGEVGSAALGIKTATTKAGLSSGTSIVASAPPTITSANEVSSTTLTGWAAPIAPGRWVRVSVTSASGFTSLLFTLTVQKS